MSTQFNTSTSWQALPRCSQSCHLYKTASAHTLLISWELLTSSLALFPFRCVFHPKHSDKQLFYLMESNSESAHSAKQSRGMESQLLSLWITWKQRDRTEEKGLLAFLFFLLSVKSKEENKPEASQSRIFFLFKWRSAAHSWSYHYTRGRENLILGFFAMI